MGRPAIDRLGVRTGRLVVVERVGSRRSASGRAISRWLCRCDCGRTTVLDGSEVAKGIVRSCGCLRAELNREKLTKAQAAIDYSAPRLHRREPDAGYISAHGRIRRERGRAADRVCVDCGELAADWSYNHDDPDALTDDEGRTYSLKPECYSPRCRSCHRTFDYAHADDNRRLGVLY